MSEEQQEQSSGGGSMKNVIIGFISTVTLGVGGFITNKLTGGDDKEATPASVAAPVINIQNTQTQQQAAGGKTVIIKEKTTEPAKPAAPVKKKDGDEFKEEAPKW
jgi:hypothetical protein